MHSYAETVFSPAVDPLAGLLCLPAKVAIYLPTNQNGKPISRQVVNYQREKVAEAFSRRFGGYTETIGNGGWYSETKGKLITEQVYIIAANCQADQLSKCLAGLVQLAGKICQDLDQEVVSLEVNGKMYFVPARFAVVNS